MTTPGGGGIKGVVCGCRFREQDIGEHFIRGSGSGGQKINKTSSCVQLIHRPSGIEIRCQQTRSQADNRYWARRDLCEKIEEQVLGEKSVKRQAAEKIRRQKRRRSRRAKAKMLDAKTKQGSKKNCAAASARMSRLESERCVPGRVLYLWRCELFGGEQARRLRYDAARKYTRLPIPS